MNKHVHLPRQGEIMAMGILYNLVMIRTILGEEKKKKKDNRNNNEEDQDAVLLLVQCLPPKEYERE
jgi:hypothetical protein